MFNLFNFLRLRRQAPTNRPPKGYFDLRISKANGKLVLVDEDGTEAPIAITSQADGTITSADISDATSDGATNKDKVLKTDLSGDLELTTLTVERVDAGNLGIRMTDLGGKIITVTAGGYSLSADRQVDFEDVAGSIAVAPVYADETAADAALDPRVLYFNDATGKFQVSSA